MADTVPGGIYFDEKAQKYHDAHGNWLTKEDAEARIAHYDELRRAAGLKTREEELQDQEDLLAKAENQRRGALAQTPVQPARIDKTPGPGDAIAGDTYGDGGRIE
jgi:hypothetical protein